MKSNVWLWLVLILTFLSGLGGIVMGHYLNHRNRPTLEDTRLERLCDDLQRKHKLAQALVATPARTADANLVEITIAGGLAICAEAKP